MILCRINEAARYRSISSHLAAAIDWLMKHFDDEFVKGIYTLDEYSAAEITVKCEEPALLPREKARLEAHKRFIDIHVPLKGTEIIGWAPVNALKYLQQAYNDQTDIEFYGDNAHSMLHVSKGQIVIFFPEDAHAPNIGLGNHRKLCIKIPVD